MARKSPSDGLLRKFGHRRIRPSVRLGWSRTKAGERVQVVQQETGTFAEFDGSDGEQTTDVTSDHDAWNIDIE